MSLTRALWKIQPVGLVLSWGLKELTSMTHKQLAVHQVANIGNVLVTSRETL